MVEALQGIIDAPTPVQMTEEWFEFPEMLDLNVEVLGALTNPDRLDEAIDLIAVDDPLLARYIHAATHLTISTNYVRAGNKANIIADRATAVLDIRTMPGSVDAVEGHRNLVPVLATVATDARFWRRKGAVVYGVGIYDEATSFSEMSSLFHGDDERVSIESVRRTTSLYEKVLERFGE